MISSSSTTSVPGRSLPSGLVERRQHLHAHMMVHRQLDRARLQDLGALRRHLEHLLVGDLVDLARLLDDPRIGRVDAVDVGVDVAAVGLERRRQRHRRGVRAAAAERRDAAVAATGPGSPARSAPRPPPCAAPCRRSRCRRCAPWRGRRRCGSGSASRHPGARLHADAAAAPWPAGRSSPARRWPPPRRIRAASCSGAISLTQLTSWLVVPDMAETTTATSLPRVDLGFDLARHVPDAIGVADRSAAEFENDARHSDLLESGV